MSGVAQFSKIEAWPDERRVRLDGRPVVLGARAFDVLMALVERRDRVVARDELLDLAWPGMVVEENNLSVQISALRKQLGPESIVNVPSRGYRLVLPASVVRGTSAAAPSTPRPAVAVLSFDTHGADETYFGEGVTEEIIMALAANRALEVEIASAITRPTDSLSAYDCVMRALAVLHHFDDGGFARAGDLLRQAIALDPGYARAYAQLAWWHVLRFAEGRSPERGEDGRLGLELSRRAVELDTRDTLALSVAGHVESFMFRHFDAAMDLFERALSIHPSCAVAWDRSATTLAYMGQGEEALRRIDIAMRLSPFDPLGFGFLTTRGTACLVVGRAGEAVAWLSRARRLNPGFRAAWRLLVAALALGDELDEARAQAAAYLQAEPGFRVDAFGSWFPLQEPHRARILDGLRRAGLPG